MFSSIHFMIPVILDIIKEAAPNAKIVLGGSHTSIAADALIKLDDIDYVITGEGEVAFVKLLHAIEHSESTDNIPGVYPTPFDLIPNLDDIYPPIHHMVPIDHYFAVLGKREVVLMTSRGCPFNCSFCSVPQSSRRMWRAHSVDRVLSEIEWARSFGATHIMFEDDNISLKKKRWVDILEGIIKQKWKLSLSARNILLTTLDKDILELMKLAGFEKINLSAESGCDRVLAEEMHKKLTVAQTEQAVRDVLAVGMKPVLNFVIGMPNETWAEIEQTGGFARRMAELGAVDTWVTVATPIFGTDMFMDLYKSGRLPEDFAYQLSYGHATFDGPDWNKKQLQDYRECLMKEFN